MTFKHNKTTDSNNTNFRTWKKGKTWLYGCSVAAVLAGGVMVSAQTSNAETPTESSQVETQSISESSAAFDIATVEASASNNEAADALPVSLDTTVSADSDTVEAESDNVKALEATVTAESSTTEKVPNSTDSSDSKAIDRSDLVKATVGAVSADIKLTKNRSNSEFPSITTLPVSNWIDAGASLNITVNTKDLIKDNTIILANIDLTSSKEGMLVNMSPNTGGTLTDSEGNIVGTITYSPTLKSVVLSVTNTITNDAPTLDFSANLAQIIRINTGTSPSILANAPFSNTLTVSGHSYTFDFTPISIDTATTLHNDSNGYDNNANLTNITSSYFHEDIKDNAVLNELQTSHGSAGNVLRNEGIMRTMSLSTDSEMIGFAPTGVLYKGVYYVSASNHTIQTDSQDTIADQKWSAKGVGQKMLSDGLNQAQLQAEAKSRGTGVYVSKQTDGSYLFVEYVAPEDMILTDAQIESMVRSNTLASASTDIDADVKATLDYYHGVLNNRASAIQIYVAIQWADEYVPNTVSTTIFDDEGNVVSKSSSTTTPNAVASGQTTVKVHYLDINGNPLGKTLTKPGTPTGKENSLGGIHNNQANVSPLATVPAGYSLVSSADLSDPDQKAQLEVTLKSLGLSSDNLDDTTKKIIFGTKSENVPFPGLAGTFYDDNGKIVTDGTGTEGYGQTDVYYFYVGTAQEIHYNIIDDGVDTDDDGIGDDEPVTILSNATYAKGYTGDSVSTESLAGKSFEDIKKYYEGLGYVVESKTESPDGIFTEDTADQNQVFNIYLRHHLTTTTETKDVDETIHYVYEEDGSKAAEDVTDKVTFTRDTVTDDVTGEIISETEWTAVDDDTTFDEKVSPTIDGYTADRASIAEVTGLTQESADVEETVIYKKDASEPTPPGDEETPESPAETPENPSPTQPAVTPENPKPAPVVEATAKPAAPAKGASILPSTGEQRTAAAVVGGFLVVAAGVIGLIIRQKRKKQ